MNNNDPLTSDETRRLEELEEIIRQVDGGYLDKARALREINATGLYLKRYPSFAKYCAAEWGLQKTHGYRLVSEADVVDYLIGKGLPIPANESHARELLRFKDDFAKAETVWRAVQESGKRITAEVIADMAEEMYPQEAAEDGSGDSNDEHVSPSTAAQKIMGIAPSLTDYDCIPCMTG